MVEIKPTRSTAVRSESRTIHRTGNGRRVGRAGRSVCVCTGRLICRGLAPRDIDQAAAIRITAHRPGRRRHADRWHRGRATRGSGMCGGRIRRRVTVSGRGAAPPGARTATRRTCRRATVLPLHATTRERAVESLVPDLIIVEAAGRKGAIRAYVVGGEAVKALAHQVLRHRPARRRGPAPTSATLHQPKFISVGRNGHARRVDNDRGQAPWWRCNRPRRRSPDIPRSSPCAPTAADTATTDRCQCG
jgi:hypothetical protein